MARVEQAEIVIIGGGIIGCSIAYHLTKLGKRDVLLIEKHGLTQGSTWHAAGMVGQLRSSRNLTRLAQMSVDLYSRLEAETGQATEWHPVGSIRLASSDDRWRECKRQATTAKTFGFEAALLTPKEAREMFPLMDTRGVLGALYTPSDGFVEPASVTQALAKGARRSGAVIREGLAATGFDIRERRIRRVLTSEGPIACDVVVNAGGMWAHEIGLMAGVKVAVAAFENQYLITDHLGGMPSGLPTLRDPDNLLYVRAEVGGLLVGALDTVAPPFGLDGIPENFAQQLLPPDFDRWEPYAELFARRLPVLKELGVRKMINGPISSSPDGEPILGPAPELDNFFLACGFVGGIAEGGGAGRLIAEWIVEGRPSLDVWRNDSRRFSETQKTRRCVLESAHEAFAEHYVLHYPAQERKAGRGARLSPVHAKLLENRAVFGSVFGWERPNWFAARGEEAIERPGFGRPNWFIALGREQRAIEDGLALVDQSSLGKLALSGLDSAGVLQRLAANDVAAGPGASVPSYLCNEQGGVEAEVTILRLDENEIIVLTEPETTLRTADWIRRHLPRDSSLTLRDTSAEYAVLTILGPRLADFMAALSPDHGREQPARPGSWSRVELGCAPALAAFVAVSGVSACQFHVPSDGACAAWEALRTAGRAFDLSLAGQRALESVRVANGVARWGHELSPETNPAALGLKTTIGLSKGDFLGRAALREASGREPTHELVRLAVAASEPLIGGEAIVIDGEVAAAATSAGYDFQRDRPIVLAVVETGRLARARVIEVEAFAERYPARRIDLRARC